MIKKIPYRDIQRMSSVQLDKELNLNGGILLVQVDSQAKYSIAKYPPIMGTLHNDDSQAASSSNE